MGVATTPARETGTTIRVGTILLLGRFFVRVIAVDHVRGDEAVDEPRNDLDADEAAYVAAHHDEAGGLLVHSALSQVAHRGR